MLDIQLQALSNSQGAFVYNLNLAPFAFISVLVWQELTWGPDQVLSDIAVS